MVELSSEQKTIFQNITRWIETEPLGSREALRGYAGTGKTTLVNEILQYIADRHVYFAGCTHKGVLRRVAVCAPTGKAASVLATKLRASSVPQTVYECGTLHSLFFSPEDCSKEKTGKLTFTVRNPIEVLDKYFLVIIDEASMLSTDMYYDLRKLDIPILLVGDSGQLDPVSGKQVPLLSETQNALVTVHRQALDNPIIRLATDVRSGKFPTEFVSPDLRVMLRGKPATKKLENRLVESATSPHVMFLTGKNTNRNAKNIAVREEHGFTSQIPLPGEKVVCLNNEKSTGFMNGQLFYVLSSENLSGLMYSMILTPEADYIAGVDRKLKVVASKATLLSDDHNKAISSQVGNYVALSEFNYWADEDLKVANEKILFFDFGYCLSVHKSQGSEWGTVYFHNDYLYKYQNKENYKKWLYTGITRAKNSLVLTL